MSGPYSIISKLISDIVLDVQDTFMEPSEFDNPYTLMYKFADSVTTPVTRVIFGSGNGPLNTMGSKIMQMVRPVPISEHGNTLINLDISLTQLGNSFNKEYYMYDYVRTIYTMVREGVDIPIEAMYNAIDRYQETFAIRYVNRSTVSNWLQKMQTIYNYELSQTNKRTLLINSIHKELSEVDRELDTWFLTSRAVVVNNVFMVQPRMISGEVITTEYGDSIFDRALVSDRIPYIGYFDNEGRGFHKIFSGGMVNVEPDYRRIVGKRDNQPNTIEFTLWLGTGSIYNATKDSFYRATYDIANHKISYAIPVSTNPEISYYDVAYESIGRMFSQIFNLTEPVLVETASEFNLYPMRNSRGEYVENGGLYNFEEFVILDKLTFDDRFRNIIYPNESVFPYYRRSRYEFLYSPMFMRDFKGLPRTTTWSMTLRGYDEGVTYSLSDDSTFTSTEGNYLRIRIFNAKGVEDNGYTIEMLTRVLALLYKDTVYRLDSRRNTYITLIENLSYTEDARRESKLLKKTDGKSDTEKISANREGIVRMREYKQKHSQFYTDSYPLTCESFKCPLTFDKEEEAKAWSHDNNKKVLPYISNGKTHFWFGCSHANYPFPNIVANEDPHSYDTVPYFPCCSKSDRTIEGVSSDYNEFYRGTNKLYSKRTLLPGKYLNTGDSGFLDQKISSYLNNYTKGSDVKKFGVVSYPSANSLLHCVMYAIRDAKYTSLYPTTKTVVGRARMRKNLEDRENYIKNIRKVMASSIHLGALKQEMHDAISFDKIKDAIEDVDNFFDSMIFYRLIEVVLGVNLFIFDSNGLEIPRHRVYSVRHSKDDRATILLHRNNGPVQTQFTDKFSHYELIVDGNTMLFDSRMTKHCIGLHNGMTSTITYSKIGKSLNGYNNIYSIMNCEELFGNAIESQIIDGFGKLRALNVAFKSGIITVFIPPNQPLNYPVSHRVYKTTVNNAVRAMDRRISSITLSTSGVPTGIWFPEFDIANCYYIEITDFNMQNLKKLKESYPVSPADVSIKGVASDITLYEEQKRTVSIIKQLVFWVYDIGRDDSFQSSAQDFCDYILTVANNKPSTSVGYYNLTLLRKVLPPVPNFHDALTYIQNNSNLVINGKFVFHNEVFRNKIAASVMVYSKKTLFANNPPAAYLKDYRISYKSFLQQPGVEVFVSTKEFNSWLKSKEIGAEDFSHIYTSITLRFSIRTEPYIYMDPEGRVYLIQNINGVTTDEPLSTRSKIQDLTDRQTLYGKAVKVSRIWNDKKENIGNNAVYTHDDNRLLGMENVITYVVNTTGIITPYHINTGRDQSKTLRVLQYSGKADIAAGRSRYAAILPLS